MQKFGMLDKEIPNNGDARKAYNDVYRGKLGPSTRGAIKVLFPAGRATGGRAPTITVV